MLEVITVAVLKDNYTYLVVDKPTRACLIIDPPEVEPVVQALEAGGLRPLAVWLTHHHADHIAGVPGLLQRYPELSVVCSHRDGTRIADVSRTVQEGDELDFGGERARVLELPGHAEGHIAYHFAESGHLFCGDVIFGASCGAVFGDTFGEMYRSVKRVSELPPDTRLWCGHEYTQNNLKFAEAVLGQPRLAGRKAAFRVPSVPLLLAEELETNPFMNLESPEVLNYLGRQPGEPEATFRALRVAKNSF